HDPAFGKCFPNVLMIKAGVTGGVQLHPADHRGLANHLSVWGAKSNFRALQSLLRSSVARKKHQQLMRGCALEQEIAFGLFRVTELVIAPDGQSLVVGQLIHLARLLLRRWIWKSSDWNAGVLACNRQPRRLRSIR